MPWTAKRKADLSGDLNLLLDDLCIQWGFCNQLRGKDLLATEEVVTGDAFASAVLTAEGFVPEHEPTWIRRIKATFTERYGSSISVESHARNLASGDRVGSPIIPRINQRSK